MHHLRGRRFAAPDTSRARARCWQSGSLRCSGTATQLRRRDGARREPSEVILASTTSTQDSGLFDVLIPAFEKANPEYKVKVIAVGTGEALKLGETKDADVLLVHAKADEEKFVAAGFGSRAQGRHVQRLRHRRSRSRSGRRQGRRPTPPRR